MDSLAEAFERFVSPHLPRLSALAHQYARTSEDAADLLQETLLRAWRGFSPTAAPAYRRAWLVVILRNIAVDWSRAERRRIRVIPLDGVELTEVIAVDAAEPFVPFPRMDEARFLELLDDRLVSALDSLEAPYREVVVLHVAGGLDYREIGEVLDCPVGTVMSRMARARRALRERLAEYASARDKTRGGRT